MNRFTKTLAALATFTALSVGVVAMAQPPESAVMQAIKDLDLTPEQREQLKTIRQAHREAHESARDEREASMKIFKQELLSANPDAKRLHGLIDARQEQMIQRMHDKLDMVLEVHSVLTPSQRKVLSAELEEVREHHRERGGRHGKHRER